MSGRREPWRVAVFGTGRSGGEVVRACGERADVELTAVLSHSPAKVGRPAGEVLGVDGLELPIAGAVDAELASRADVLVHTGLGTAAERVALLGGAADLGLSSITVNGMIHPPTALGAEVAAALDARARAGGARIVGTGVNPGLLLDLLPALWLTMSTARAPVRARRVSEIREWGDGALDDEVRLGADPATVADNGALSLAESVGLIGAAAGLDLSGVEDEYEPLVARSRRQHRGRVVEAGQVVGFRRRGIGLCDGEARIEVEWVAVFCIDPEVDDCEEEAAVAVGGENWVQASAGGQFLSDPYPSTAARAINSIAPLLAKEPGLWRPDQLPVSA